MTPSLLKPLLSAAALLLALFGGPILIAQTQDSARINHLLQQAKSRAVQANHDADLISSYTRSGTSWRSHMIQLDSMKVHINEMGKMLVQMDAARPEGSPWQQEAIDDIEPLLRSMADHLSTMIDHLGKNQERINMPEYVTYTKANLELSDKLLAMIEDYVDYAQAKATVDELEQKLQLPAATSGGY